MRTFLAILIAFVSQSNLFADESYKITLTRPSKAGERYELEGKAEWNTNDIWTYDGEKVPGGKSETSLDYKAEVKVVAVTPRGLEKEMELTFKSIVLQVDGKPDTTLKDGDVVAIKLAESKTEVTVNGTVAPEMIRAMISNVFKVYPDDYPSDDELARTPESVKLGDTWKGDAEVSARLWTKNGVSVSAANIDFTVTMAELTTLEGHRAFQIRAANTVKPNIADFVVPGWPDGKASNYSSSGELQMTYPFDVSQGTLRSFEKSKITLHTAGIVERDGIKYQAKLESERTSLKGVEVRRIR